MNAAQLSGQLRRWPFCVACVVVTMLAIGAAVYFRGEAASLELVHADRSREGEAMLSLLVGASTQRQELAAAREAVRRIDENLVVEANLAENLWYFYKLEEQTKARIDLHQISSPSTDKSPLYRRIPYTLRVTGGFEQVAAFLLALETGPRLVKVTSFNYSRTDAAGLALALDLNVELLGKK